MKPLDKLFRVILLLIGIAVLSFNARLYYLYDQQTKAVNAIKDQQKMDAQVNSNKFKYQEDQMANLNKDLEDAQQQIKTQNDALTDEKDALAAQKDALLQEVEKRQQVANESKSIQTSLVDIKAEADAIKQDMKEWQRDYVSVLAELEKKMDDSQAEIKSVNDNVNSLKADIEKVAHPMDSNVPPAPEKKIERTELQSQ